MLRRPDRPERLTSWRKRLSSPSAPRSSRSFPARASCPRRLARAVHDQVGLNRAFASSVRAGLGVLDLHRDRGGCGRGEPGDDGVGGAAGVSRDHGRAFAHPPPPSALCAGPRARDWPRTCGAIAGAGGAVGLLLGGLLTRTWPGAGACTSTSSSPSRAPAPSCCCAGSPPADSQRTHWPNLPRYTAAGVPGDPLRACFAALQSGTYGPGDLRLR